MNNYYFGTYVAVRVGFGIIVDVCVLIAFTCRNHLWA
jgi:hypothetical protein